MCTVKGVVLLVQLIVMARELCSVILVLSSMQVEKALVSNSKTVNIIDDISNRG